MFPGPVFSRVSPDPDGRPRRLSLSLTLAGGRAEHTFLTAQPRPLAQLQRAIRTGNLALALHAASGMERVSLEDAFAICLLLRAERDRYERACVRWIERFASEVDGVTLMDVYQAARVFQLLPRRPSSKPEVAPMVNLLRRHAGFRAPQIDSQRCTSLRLARSRVSGPA
jgi:hypothetical protein